MKKDLVRAKVEDVKLQNFKNMKIKGREGNKDKGASEESRERREKKGRNKREGGSKQGGNSKEGAERDQKREKKGGGRKRFD